MNFPRPVCVLSLFAFPLGLWSAAPPARPVTFEKLTLTSEYWCDGVPDILTASKLGVFVFLTKRK